MYNFWGVVIGNFLFYILENWGLECVSVLFVVVMAVLCGGNVDISSGDGKGVVCFCDVIDEKTYYD